MWMDDVLLKLFFTKTMFEKSYFYYSVCVAMCAYCPHCSTKRRRLGEKVELWALERWADA